MITREDQEQLFKLLARTLHQNITCYAFGGTAMMFSGLKDETKDVDLLFEKPEDRQEFIRALKAMGFAESTPGGIYIPEKLRNPHAPLMYRREDARFDLFLEKIFKTILSPNMKENVFAVHEYKEAHTLTIKVFRTEIIVLLKAVTDRDRDFEDILTIVKKDSHFDWQYLIDEVLWQYQHGDSWVLSDTERMLQELKKYVFIEEKYLKQLYAVRQKEVSAIGRTVKKRKTTKSL